jgi:glycosyltransferase involved in cell wall biosynthesis
MRKIVLVFRKSQKGFNSIENVFYTILPFLQAKSVELPYSSSGLINRIKNLFYLLKLKNDIVHITGHDHYIFLKRFNYSILTIHDIEALKRKKGIKRFIFKKIWFDIPIRNVSIVTTISEFSKNELRKVVNNNIPIYVIPNPLTLDIKYQPQIFNSKCPRILHIGVKVNKNLVRLIKALNGIDCRLIIVGDLASEIVELLHNHSIEFEVKTDLSNDQVIEEYYKCDLVSFVSTYEGFGLPIVEAQAAGRPIVTSNVASMPEVAGKGAVLVDPFSIESIRNGVQLVINDSATRSEIISQGLINVNRFKPLTIANQYKDLYSKL